ncbi:MAG: RtcB family protein [Candidatus Thiodiazotropha sp. (ex Dulcina madagascariensis)]|nr:RtcB family protein [Candidatus Thiodiazotropha sp. (ex Dulcina madagascariensis)]
MPVKQLIQAGGKPVKVWTDEVESGAREQLANLSTLPFIHHHVAAMPDVPYGLGATIRIWPIFQKARSTSMTMSRRCTGLRSMPVKTVTR